MNPPPADAGNGPSWKRRLLLIGLIIFALLPAIQMWHWVSSNWVPLPYWDEWHTPGNQFESWRRGTLTLTEMFSQHNESRLFFSRLLYFTLEHFGGWDVRKEIRVVFFGVCALAFLLLHLLRRTPGATPLSTLAGWTLMMGICFAPVQVENFLYGIEIETFFPGFAVLAVAAINLSRLSFRTKTLLNLALACIATYTFANGMLVWVLAWPLPSPNEQCSRPRRRAWLALYAVAGAIAIGSYFIGYHRPSYHPAFASPLGRFWDLAHYIVLWCGRYFATDFAGPFLLGIVALALFGSAFAFALWTGWQRGDWRTFYPWLLLGLFALITATTTALGRLGFGVEQALDVRYLAFSRFFYLALFGLGFALYSARIQLVPVKRRALLFGILSGALGFLAALWISSAHKNVAVLAQYHEGRLQLLRALEWMEPIPDNPDLALIFPFPDELRSRARFLEEQGVLRLPFVHGPLSASVRQAPPPVAGAKYGAIDVAKVEADDQLHLQGWAWLPGRRRPADCVVLGAENSVAEFKPFTVLITGKPRPDVRATGNYGPYVYRAGFDHAVAMENLPPGEITIKGWAIDLRAQKAYPLAGAIRLPAR